MGYYITEDSKGFPLSVHGKVEDLEEDGAEIIATPTEWMEDLVCVVDNGMWQAAAYCYSPTELSRFLHGRNDRSWTWMVYKHAKNLSGYNERIRN